MSAPPASPSPGLILAERPPSAADVVVEDPTWTPAGLHRALFDPTQDLPGYLLRAVRTLVADRTPGQARRHLPECGVTALDGLYSTLAVAAVGHTDPDTLWTFLGVTRELGSAHDRLGLRSSRADLETGTPPLFAASPTTPHIAVVLDDGFTRSRRAQRERILELLVDLAEGCRVTIVAGPIERGCLYHRHREQLPASVEADCNPRGGTTATESITDQVAAAHDTLAPDSPAVAILEALADHPTESLSYDALAETLSRARSTIRYHVTQRLQTHDLVARYDRADAAVVTLTRVGRQFLESRPRRQNHRLSDYQSRSASVDPASKSCVDIREVARERDGPAGDSPDHHRTDHHGDGLARPRRYHPIKATAARICGTDTDIAIVDHPIADVRDDGGDVRAGRWHYDADGDHLVVGAQWSGPLQYAVSLALALTHWRTFETVLTPDRLHEGVFTTPDGNPENPWVLRGTRQLGYLPNDAADGAAYVTALQEAREDLLDLTRQLDHGDYSQTQRDRRREILRAAHGLIGTVTHLLDRCGVGLTRELRLPDYARNYNHPDDREAIARFLAKAVPIASRYGEFAAESVLFEDRDHKRAFTLAPPAVDLTDPAGTHIGSWTVVGEFNSTIDAFRDTLASALEAPAALQADAETYAPFTVPVAIDSPAGTTRDAYRGFHSAVGRPHETGRALLTALRRCTGSIYDVAAAHTAGDMDTATTPHERLERICTQVGPERLCPDAAPTVGRIVHTVATATSPLTKADIADRGGISTSAVYDSDHWAVLSEYGLLTRCEDGWTLTLPTDPTAPSASERTANHHPTDEAPTTQCQSRPARPDRPPSVPQGTTDPAGPPADGVPPVPGPSRPTTPGPPAPTTDRSRRVAFGARPAQRPLTAFGDDKGPRQP